MGFFCDRDGGVFLCFYLSIRDDGREIYHDEFSLFKYRFFLNRKSCILFCASCVHMGRIGFGGRAGWDGCVFWLVRLLKSFGYRVG